MGVEKGTTTIFTDSSLRKEGKGIRREKKKRENTTFLLKVRCYISKEREGQFRAACK